MKAQTPSREGPFDLCQGRPKIVWRTGKISTYIIRRNFHLSNYQTPLGKNINVLSQKADPIRLIWEDSFSACEHTKKHPGSQQIKMQPFLL